MRYCLALLATLFLLSLCADDVTASPPAVAGIATWISMHWTDLLALYGAVVMVATGIVKLTPTPRDDAILAKLIACLNWFSTVNPTARRDARLP